MVVLDRYVHDPFLDADGAVAIGDVVNRNRDLKLNRSTMTATRMLGHSRSLFQRRLLMSYAGCTVETLAIVASCNFELADLKLSCLRGQSNVEISTAGN